MPVAVGTAKSVDWRLFHKRLREQVPIVAVLGSLGVEIPSRRDAAGFKVACPLHQDKSPSMHVYEDQNRVWCYSCDQGFDVVELYAEVLNLSYVEAADELGERYGISPELDGQVIVDVAQTEEPDRHEPWAKKKEPPGVLPEFMGEDEAWFYHRMLKPEHYEWYEKERLIPHWLVDAVGLGHTPLNDFPLAYVIPVWGESICDLVTLRFRRDDNLLERRRQVLEEEQIEWLEGRKYFGKRGRNDVFPFGVWGLPRGGGRYVVLVESELDTLMLMAGGIPAFTVTMGVSARRWREWKRYIEPFLFWVVAFDDDRVAKGNRPPAGPRAAAVMELEWPNRVVKFGWPEEPWGPKEEGGGDPTDFVKRFGVAAFAERCEAALGRVVNSEARGPVSAVGQRLWKGCDEISRGCDWVR